jgi:hypothetical protein
MTKLLTSFFSCLLVLFSLFAHAQWSTNAAVNNSICTAAGDDTWNVNTFKIPPNIISDGTGGAIITWVDERNGVPNKDIFAQRINGAGVIQWTSNGVAICTATGNQQEPVIISDGAGGAIITWMDNRGPNWDLYTQRINAAGVVQWAGNGVVISAAAAAQTDPAVVSDGSGGAIISWMDARNSFADIFAQRISASGVVQWTVDGVGICTVAGSNQSNTMIATDAAGGAFIVWDDARGADHDIYAQRINAGGVVQWAANGIALCTAPVLQRYPAIVTDGAGGVIVSWWDLRNGVSWKTYAQRLLASGATQWTANGVQLGNATGQQTNPTMITDGAGGAIITWKDDRSGPNNDDIYVQHVNAAGAIQWAAGGNAVCTSAGNQENPTLVSDGLGGAIISWGNAFGAANNDLYAQRTDAAGINKWIANGTVISSATGTQERSTLISDGTGGAIITWQDRRNPSEYDIYAQNICASGIIGGATCGVLPIELLSFTGQYHSATKAINLAWVTAQETNTSRFEIEKSLDGIQFKKLGQKAAAGNSALTLSYTFTDPAVWKGNNYYRLTTVDLDGALSFSKILTIYTPGDITNEAIYPNPSTGKLFIHTNLVYKNATVKVFNSLGQVIVEKRMVNGPDAAIDISQCQRGIYRVMITEGGFNRTFMVMKD